MTSIVIPAHNEGGVIARCLDAVLSGAGKGELDVTVAANACTDDTVSVARTYGVRVLDLAEPGKANALNAADAVAVGFPRIYLDADIVVDSDGLRALAAALDGPATGSRPAALAAAPRRLVVTDGRPLVVRAYFAIQRHLPAFDGSLFGRGAVALSQEGRARFDRFPELVADDLFLDGLFGASEKVQVDDVTSRVEAPLRTGALVERLVRVRRANAVMRAAAARGEVTATVRGADRGSWLREVVLRRPWLAPAAVCYVGVTLAAALRARRGGGTAWERDETTRPSAQGAARPGNGAA